MRWLVLHSSGGKQVLTLDKRQVIQVIIAPGSTLLHLTENVNATNVTC